MGIKSARQHDPIIREQFRRLFASPPSAPSLSTSEFVGRRRSGNGTDPVSVAIEASDSYITMATEFHVVYLQLGKVDVNNHAPAKMLKTAKSVEETYRLLCRHHALAERAIAAAKDGAN